MAERAPSIEERISAVMAGNEEPPPQDEAPPQAELEQTAPADAGVSVSEGATPPPSVAEEDDGVPIETLNDLAEALGADVADLYNIRLAVDIDGQGREEVTLGQWKDTYRDSKVLEAKRAELDRRAAEVEAAHKAKVEAFESKEREAAELLTYMEQQTFQRYAGIDWNHLRTSDPGQWAALSFQFEQEKNQLAQIRQAAAVKWDNAKRELAEAEQARERELLTQELQQLPQLVPEWKDPARWESERTQIAHFLLSQGFTSEEISRARLKTVLLARDAMKYREMTAKAKTEAKRVFKLGKKVLTSGQRQAPAGQNQQVSVLQSRLKKSGHIKDAAALISERLKG